MTAHTAATGLEAEAGSAIGRDPREMSRPELESLGHGKQPLLRVIRARCLDCCCEQPSEVRKCTATRCANWPYRMGTDPWRAEPSEAQREQARQMAARRAGHAQNPHGGGVSGDDSPPAGRMMPGGSDGAGEDAVAGGGADASPSTA